jgi:hypothetical protein
MARHLSVEMIISNTDQNTVCMEINEPWLIQKKIVKILHC